MPLIVFIYELLIAVVVFVILNAIGDSGIAFLIAAVLFIIMLTNSFNNPYKLKGIEKEVIMPLIVILYELLIAVVVFVILNAIIDSLIAFVIAAVLFIIMLKNSFNNPYKGE